MLTPPTRILEYLSRDDADRAVKELSGKDLRGRAVRVDLDDSVSHYILSLALKYSHSIFLAPFSR